MTMRISAANQARLKRIAQGEMMHPSVVRSLVRRGIVRRVESVPPYERVEWNRVVARFYLYEILDPEAVREAAE